MHTGQHTAVRAGRVVLLRNLSGAAMFSSRSPAVSLWLYLLVVIASVMTFSWLTLQDEESVAALHAMSSHEADWISVAQADE